MAGGRSGTPASAQWGAIALVVVLALAVGAVAYLAYDRANPAADGQSAAPVPTFSLGVETASPTPTAAATETTEVAREDDRFLSIGSAAWWRSTAGACGGAEPLVERSDDQGQTWVDVTGRYRDIAAVASLDAFADTEAEMVVGVGEDCTTQGWRTFTQGTFWEPYDDLVLSAGRYISPVDAAIVETPSGAVDAPCSEARGLRASGDVVALICDAQAWVLGADGQTWAPVADAAAVSVDGADIVLAGSSPDCDGVSLTRYLGADPEAAQPVGCAEGTAADAPTAIAATADGFVVWAGEDLTPVSR
ncbi:hypothetical protein RZO50_07435 [Microbacterium sp. SSW1-59]|uniref:hypothetical protein n=1 Tax=Microbacterium xanthum TaxID=3079794 RepID=UPI002AD4BDFB|nr:hypothetical protein [Microbacterium sp. SSW1-59]MDZ8201342.1 hypothetical protein [Microbacterium sp. SSW1-59]